MSTVSPLKLTCKGFTLSELLVSLAVLGLIAGLTVPTVWASVKQSQDRALLTTAIRTLSEATSKLVNEPPALVSPSNTTWHAYDPLLNSADDSFVEAGNAANNFTMPGGVVLSRFTGTVTTGRETILLDTNGATGPNTIGKDRVMITTCFDPTGTCPATANITVGSLAQEAGIVGPTPDATAGAGNVAFYNTLTQST